MANDEYTPTAEELLDHYEELSIFVLEDAEAAAVNRRAAERTLARVRAEAAREALQGLADQEAQNAERRRFKDDQRGYGLCRHAKHAADDYRMTHYPEQEADRG